MRQVRKVNENGAETEGAAILWSQWMKESRGNGFGEVNSALVRYWSMWELRKVRRAVLRAEWFCLEARAMRGWRRMPSMYGDRTARTSVRVGGLVDWGAGGLLGWRVDRGW